MALSVKHAFTSAKSDGLDTTKVQPSNWNADHNLTAAIDKVLGTDSSSTTVQELACTAAGRAILAAVNVAAQKAALNVAEIPIGGGFHWHTGGLPPSNGSVVWGWANGQAISRTTYATLFALWSTTYGIGDNSTTFNVPDRRDVVGIGYGTMGGTAARGLITNQGGANNSMPATFGEAAHTLLTAELAVHAHANTLSTPTHTHANTLTDNGHNHTYTDTGHTHSYSGDMTRAGAVGVTAGSSFLGGSNSTVSNTIGITINNNTTGITINNGAVSSGDSITNVNAGSGSAHNNIQPTFTCAYIIRLA